MLCSCGEFFKNPKVSPIQGSIGELVTAACEDFGFGESHEFLIISNANQ